MTETIYTASKVIEFRIRGYERLFRASLDHDRFGALSRHLNPNVRFPAAFVRFNPQSRTDAGGTFTAWTQTGH